MQMARSICFLLIPNLCALCSPYCIQEPPRTFHLLKRCQRSRQAVVELENVATLNECFDIAIRSRGLALNYSPLRGVRSNSFEADTDSKTALNFPRRSTRRHFFHQPEEFFNCHVLQCPESSAFTTLTPDSRFDYYSLYGNPPGPKNLTCVPGVGIFQLNSAPEKYSVAFQRCKRIANGSLAHIASEVRTNELGNILRGHEFMNGSLKLAYVGLNYTAAQAREFKTSEGEHLSCFLYRAWAPGHPKRENNNSCVAITTDITWMTVDCEQKLPYFCELYTTSLNDSLYGDACGI